MPDPAAVIVSSARTPFGRLGGALASKTAVELGAVAIGAAVDRARVDPAAVDNVVIGQVLQAGAGQIPSRQAQVAAGIPREVTSETLNKVCASGMRAIGIADLQIRAGDIDLAVAGGMESMSGAPYLLPGARSGLRYDHTTMLDAVAHDGLTNPFTGGRMLEEANGVASELGVGREEMDEWAARSHRLAAEATEAGRLGEELVPVTVRSRREELSVETDEPIRPGTTVEALAKLPAIGGEGATHTAGNAPGINDGAAAVVVASAAYAESEGLPVLARVLAYGTFADDFAYLARTPAGAARAALAKLSLEPGAVDLWEINEAFASVAVNTVRELDIDPERVNVNGGAIAIGHPVGASGARIVGSLVYELRRRGGGIGVAAICSGGGQGDAIVLEVAGG